MQKKERIAICDLVTSFGGVQRVMANLLPELRKNFDVCVVDPYCNSDYAKILGESDIKCYFSKRVFDKTFIGGKGTSKRFVKLLLSVPRIFKMRRMFSDAISEIKADYIYTNHLSTLRLLGSIRSIRGIPFVYHSHGHTSPSDISRSMVQFINRRVKAVIPVSYATADILHEAGVRPEIVHVCHNAIPIEWVEKQAESAPSEPLPEKKPGQIVFAIAATVQHIKGQHLAIDALSHVVKKGYDASLWVVGHVATGGKLGYLENLRKKSDELEIADRVHFLGWRNDVYQVINEADVVMLCSLTPSESFGMVLAEAMALEKPCIGANIGGMPEVIEHNLTGLVFQPGSVESLANTMISLVSDPELRMRFGQNGKHRTEKCFSIEKQSKTISKIIKNIRKP